MKTLLVIVEFIALWRVMYRLFKESDAISIVCVFIFVLATGYANSL